MRMEIPRSTGRCLSVCGVIALLVFAAGCGDDDSSGNNNTPPDWTVGTVLGWVDDGVLAEVQADYGPVKIIRIQGTHYDMGFQYGYLLHEHIQSIWDEIFGPLIADELGFDQEFAIQLFGTLMDQAWNHVLPYIPEKYMEELDGVHDGALAAGHPDPESLVEIVRRIMMLVDTSQAEAFGGSLGEMQTFYNSGFSEGAQDYYAQAELDLEGFEQQQAMDGIYVPTPFKDAINRMSPVPACSFFGAWGDRTDGRQVATRVLDWSADMGLGPYALITVFVPEGGVANVTVGYVGLFSAFAGMNEAGIALSAIGSGSAMDRLKTQSISIRGRDLLETAEDMDSAVAMFSGDVSSLDVVATSVGTVAGLFYGDPAGGGVASEGAVSEFNGVFASMFRYGAYPECGESAWLYEFAEDGTTANAWNHVDDPDVVNLESDAYEIDATGLVRTFEVDANQEFVYDATSGLLIDDPAGEPYPVGAVYPCSVYRADPAMAYGVRRWQTAANGPQRDSANKLMHLSGVYRSRHKPQGDMINAYYNGTRFEYEGTEVIPDNGGQRTLIGVEQAKAIVRVVGMENANVFSVIYDTTDLVIYVAFESGSGASWTRAVDNEYYEFRLADLIPQR